MVSAQQYIGVMDNKIVAHTGVIQFPMRKGWKRIHRFVVLPDYQGIGIGMQFINEVCKIKNDMGFRVNLTTTTPSLIGALTRSSEWNLHRFGRSTNAFSGFAKYGTGDKEKNRKITESAGKSSSKNRITYSFNFKKQ